MHHLLPHESHQSYFHAHDSYLVLFAIHKLRKVPQFIRLALSPLHIALEFF